MSIKWTGKTPDDWLSPVTNSIYFFFIHVNVLDESRLVIKQIRRMIFPKALKMIYRIYTEIGSYLTLVVSE